MEKVLENHWEKKAGCVTQSGTEGLIICNGYSSQISRLLAFSVHGGVLRGSGETASEGDVVCCGGITSTVSTFRIIVA